VQTQDSSPQVGYPYEARADGEPVEQASIDIIATAAVLILSLCLLLLSLY
jgi:hypothetical protein